MARQTFFLTKVSVPRSMCATVSGRPVQQTFRESSAPAVSSNSRIHKKHARPEAHSTQVGYMQPAIHYFLVDHS
jgi:hypothetical protein